MCTLNIDFQKTLLSKNFFKQQNLDSFFDVRVLSQVPKRQKNHTRSFLVILYTHMRHYLGYNAFCDAITKPLFVMVTVPVR